MRIKPMLVAISFAFAIAPILCPETTSAFPKCNVPNCGALSGKHSRAEIHTACEKAGGIETGTTATSGGYACYSKDDTFVECDDKGQCIGGGGSRQVPKGPRQLEGILGGGTRPAPE